MGVQQHMPQFRMQHAMEQFSAAHDAAADAGADGDVDDVFQTLGRSIGDFSEQGSVHIGIKTDGDLQRLPKSADDIVVGPARFRCCGDIAVSGGSRIQIQRAEAGDAQSCDLLILEIVNDLRDRFFRKSCGNGDLLQDLSVFIADSTHHFGAAGF